MASDAYQRCWKVDQYGSRVLHANEAAFRFVLAGFCRNPGVGTPLVARMNIFKTALHDSDCLNAFIGCDDA